MSTCPVSLHAVALSLPVTPSTEYELFALMSFMCRLLLRMCSAAPVSRIALPTDTHERPASAELILIVKRSDSASYWLITLELP